MAIDVTPKTGKDLFNWAKSQEMYHGIGLLKYLVAWGKLNDFEGRIFDWTEHEVVLGHQECVRYLNRRAF